MDPSRIRIRRSNERRAKRHALVPDPVEQPTNSSSTLTEPWERESAVRAHLREVWAAAKGIQPNRTAFPEPSAARLADASLLSDPDEASLRKEWRMPFPAMGQNNDPQAIRRSCPSRDYVACFTKELRERYPFTQYHKRHPPPSCYTGAARARAVPDLQGAGRLRPPELLQLRGHAGRRGKAGRVRSSNELLCFSG